MTAQSRATLKAEFEDGDVPDGTNYADLIDSFLSLIDSTAQSVASPITVPSITVTGEVSAGQVNAVEVSASVGSFQVLGVAGEVSAATAFVSGAVCAGTLFIGGNEVLAAGAGATIEVFFESTATTSFAGAGTFTTLRAVTSSDSTFTVEFEHTSSAGEHEIKYIGPNAKTFHVAAHISFEILGNNKLGKFCLAKNGTELTKSEMQRFVSTGTDVGAISVGSLISLVSGDTVDVRMANATDTTDAVVTGLTIIAQQT